MFSYEQRMKAVQLYIKYNRHCAPVLRELGYPKNRHSILNWYKEFTASHDLHEQLVRKTKYSMEQRQKAITYYLEHGKNISDTIKALGFPSRNLLRSWIREDVPDKILKKHSIPHHFLVHLTQKEKEQAVQDFCLRKGSVQEIADTYNVSRFSIYNWAWQMLGKGNLPVKPKSETNSDTMTLEDLKEENKRLQKENEILERKNYWLRMEYDALKLASELLKKDEGVNLITLTNREKCVVIGALRKNYPLKELLHLFHIAKSSYCYQQSVLKQGDKYKELRQTIRTAFEDSHNRYGYRRIHVMLKKLGKIVSEKVIRRLMKQEQLHVNITRRRHYSSYQGEITPPVENLLNRNFHADRPNEKWLTDITEFSIPSGKVYLSPIIDCFDGLPVTWTIGTSPNAELVNTMLDDAIKTLTNEEHPIIHSDRGCHYRWPGWIERMNKAGLTRSMSKKGCSPDNSACEGFFGRLKNEMFYGYSWQGITVEQFMEELEAYMHWYAEDRIKLSLGGMSPLQYRKHLGLIDS